MLPIFFLMAAVLIASAVGVVSFRNTIYSALCLVANLLTVAGLFATLDANFLATVQVIVYAGAIMVLVIFLLMLLNLKDENPQKFRGLYVFSATLVGALFLWMVIPYMEEVFQVFITPAVPMAGNVKAMGSLIYTKYVFPFEATSILILAALVGAVMLGKHRRGKGS